MIAAGFGRAQSNHANKSAMTASSFIHSWRDEILRRLLRNAGQLLLGQTAASALNLIAVEITARALGPNGFGLLAGAAKPITHLRVSPGLCKTAVATIELDTPRNTAGMPS